jgi:hypothetical protein
LFRGRWRKKNTTRTIIAGIIRLSRVTTVCIPYDASYWFLGRCIILFLVAISPDSPCDGLHDFWLSNLGLREVNSGKETTNNIGVDFFVLLSAVESGYEKETLGGFEMDRSFKQV